MPLRSIHVGAPLEPFAADVDARWTMAYAAALGDHLDCYFDTRAPSLVAHPLFPVCVEWIGQTRPGGIGPLGLTPEEARRGVHYAHDLTPHRPVRPVDRFTVTPMITGVTRHRAGAAMVTRFEAVDGDGRPAWTTYSTGLLRDVAVEGDDVTLDGPTILPVASDPTGSSAVVEVPLSAGLAHIYTECARIWNPIHTDATVAEAAGLPAIILHGTATLALAVSLIIERFAGHDPTRVRRIAGRFGAMVLMPAVLQVELSDPQPTAGGGAVRVEVRTPEGAPAVRNGVVILDP